MSAIHPYPAKGLYVNRSIWGWVRLNVIFTQGATAAILPSDGGRSQCFILSKLKKLSFLVRASSAVAGRGGRLGRSEAEAWAPEAPEEILPDRREGRARRDNSLFGQDAPAGSKGRRPWRAGVQEGCGFRYKDVHISPPADRGEHPTCLCFRNAPCPSGADTVKLEEKTTPVAGPKKRAWGLFQEFFESGIFSQAIQRRRDQKNEDSFLL